MSRSSITAAVMLAALAVGSPALSASSNQFDLVCKGQQQLATGKPATPWTERFRFDLDAKRWCRGTCKEPTETSMITADRIVLSNSRASLGSKADVETSFSRTDGTVREYVAAGWSGSTFGIAEGKCTRAYFSGFPQAKF